MTKLKKLISVANNRLLPPPENYTQLVVLIFLSCGWLLFISSANLQTYLSWQGYLVVGRYALALLALLMCVPLWPKVRHNVLTCYLCCCMIFQSSCAFLEPATSFEYYEYISYFFLLACLAFQGRRRVWLGSVAVVALLTHAVPLFSKDSSYFVSMSVVVFTFSTPIVIFLLAIIILQLNSKRYLALQNNIRLQAELLYAEQSAKQTIASELAKARLQISETAGAVAIAKTTQMLAHDVKQPFMLLREVINGLLMNNDERYRQRLITRSLPEVERSLVTVDAMLDDILLIDSKDNLYLQEIDTQKLIEQAVATINQLDSNLQVTFSYNFTHNQLLVIDYHKMLRVLVNIINNALQATASHISFRSRDDQSQVELVIANDGQRLEPEHLDKMFTPFFTFGKKTGTGLGLAIVLKVVEAHGGRVWCANDAEFGTSFYLRLPAKAKPAKITSRIIFLDDSLIYRLRWQETFGDRLTVYSRPEELFNQLVDNSRLLTDCSCVITDYYFTNNSQETGLTLATHLRRHGYQGSIYLASNSVFDRKKISTVITDVIDKDPTKAEQLLGGC